LHGGGGHGFGHGFGGHGFGHAGGGHGLGHAGGGHGFGHTGLGAGHGCGQLPSAAIKLAFANARVSVNSPSAKTQVKLKNDKGISTLLICFQFIIKNPPG